MTGEEPHGCNAGNKMNKGRGGSCGFCYNRIRRYDECKEVRDNVAFCYILVGETGDAEYEVCINNRIT